MIRGWDQTVPGHNVGSRLVVSLPPEYGYGSQGMPAAGIGGGATLVFVIDIISTRCPYDGGHLTHRLDITDTGGTHG